MNKNENQMESAADKTMTNGKAPYSPPRLTSYGDIRDLTQTVGTSGMIDTPATIVKNRTN
ncbi:MAG TPA: lasso RiPP family leader peptide-containing protein [Blastocatellia bacterium]|nr:lasso RiPP family leader peptide-containing protein [Blastocatellia bacterium]